MQTLFARHYLATAITLAILPAGALATTLDISNLAPTTLSSSYTDLTLTGTVNANHEALVDLTGNVNGNLTNNADMLIEGAGIFAINGTLYLEWGSTVGGDFINNGQLISRDIDDVNVWIGNAAIGGTFINNGLIEKTGDRSPGTPSMEIYSSTLTQGFVNNGTIAASGNESIALEIGQSRLGSFDNSGSITADGNGAIGVYVTDGTTLDSAALVNRGDISASGLNSTAVVLAERLLLENQGTLTSQGIGVDLSQSGWASFEQSAGKVDAPIAIKGNGHNLVRFKGGGTKGDLSQLALIEVQGDVQFETTLIDANYLEVSSGRLTLVRPNSLLTGNLELLGGHLELLLNDSVSSTTPYLQVAGYAEVDPDTRILLTPTPNDFTLDGPRSFQLIEASEWSGPITPNDPATALANLSVQSTSALMKVNSYSINGNILEAEVDVQVGSEAAELVAIHGATANAQRALAAFSYHLDALAVEDPLFVALGNADAHESARIAEQLTPEVNGASALSAIEGLRLFEAATTTSGVAAQDDQGEWRSWINLQDSNGHTGERQQARGFDLHTKSVAIGLERSLAEGSLGIGYSHYQGNASSHNGNKLDSQGHLLGLYGSQVLDGFVIQGNLTAGWFDNESKRYIAGTRAKGSPDGRLLGASLVGAYPIALSNDLSLEPQVGARYSQVRLDGYREKGSSAALHTGASRYETGDLGAGVKLSGTVPLEMGRLKPEASIMAWHDTIGDRNGADSRFLLGGDTFASQGVRQARDSYEGNLGATYRLGNIALNASYSRTLRNDAAWRAAQVSFAYAF
ncbi:autotransporter outer membrane beta-barrel domain-containing protein [Pseudomonas tohonis]|uniref:autotransporter family protein n=1 Tax=Pseudomonas tohonis TaxID=2725477 RepID=UPI00255BBDEE|nr:autotransporter outer membrane beta-barrel domain-containing protein [Pseudomonas tohonis]